MIHWLVLPYGNPDGRVRRPIGPIVTDSHNAPTTTASSPERGAVRFNADQPS